MRTISKVYESATDVFMKNNNPLPAEDDCASMLLDEINDTIEAENQIRHKSAKFKMLTDIPAISVAMLIANRDDVALIAPGDKSQSNQKVEYSAEQRLKLPLGIYQKDGGNEGVWEVTNTHKGAFSVLVKKYKSTLKTNELIEIFDSVKERARIVPKCVIPHYVAVDNGVVDVKSKQFFQHSPDLAFTSKIHTPLNFNATNPHISIPEDGSVFDVDSWLQSLGSQELVLSIMEVIQKACMPLTKHDKMCLFFNTMGNNSKGTICQLIRNLLGEDTVISIPLDRFGTEYGLANLPSANAIVTDENNMTYIKGLADLKSVITGDKVTIREKYQKAFDYSFNGLVLQCVNALPRVDDKSPSFLRRLHIIPFSVCFTGAERKYIKSRLIASKEVKEYILKLVLIDMPYREEFTETSLTKSALEEYRIVSNSVVAFLDEILPQCRWNLLPAKDYLYEIYKSWYKRLNPSGSIIKYQDFLNSTKEYVNKALNEDFTFEWEWTDCTKSDNYIDKTVIDPPFQEYKPVHMIADYYSSANFLFPSDVKEKYSGLKRRNFVVPRGTSNDDTPQGESKNEV